MKPAELIYYGRSIDGRPPYQPLLTHLQETAENMEKYCGQFTSGKIGECCGKYHDIGKYSAEFQKRVRGENLRTDHAAAGAKLLFEHAQKEIETGSENSFYSALTYYLLTYIIAGHHTGLPDFGNANAESSTLYQHLHNSNIPDCSSWKTEIEESYPILENIINEPAADTLSLGFTLFLYTHFLFSCLIDADRTSAQNFPTPIPKQNYPKLADMQKKLETHMSGFSAKEGELNTIRQNILKDCKKAADTEPGMFTLTVPTGGGKTLSSLSFALKHAVKNDMDRIIYTIPFTSIIEQNAGVYKNIFGEENVLEHHSNFILPDQYKKDTDTKSNETERLALAVSNWDVPLILTTNVQFFESLFSANPSKSRKVHNIANSVIILDEVQALPNELLKPCMYALAELVNKYRCTVVLCTATQPDFKQNNILPDISVRDIISNYPELSAKMKRTAAAFIGKQTNSSISKLIVKEKQTLCIVNTKKHASDLYNLIRTEGDCYHLSTNMYPAHRKKIISEIRTRLKEGKTCRVISTQLIEAGVDLDFPVVFRSLAGVDSLVQAAGRCNREGKRDIGQVIIFEPAEEYLTTGYLKQTADITGTFKNDLDLLSDEAIKRYFKALFSIRDEQTDKYKILSACKYAIEEAKEDCCPRYPFREISDKFKLIQDEGNAVVIPVPEAVSLLKKVTDTNLPYIQKMIAPYCVNVRETALNKLFSKNLVHVEHDAFTVLSSLTSYDKDTGLLF